MTRKIKTNIEYKNQKNIRTCFLTRKRLPKSLLVRIVKIKTGEVYLDNDYKIKGRGLYFQNNDDIFKKLSNGKILKGKLAIKEVPQEILDFLKN